MKEVFESMLGVFFLIVVMLTSTTVISASIDARNADATMQAYITEVEHSNFSNSILSAVFDQAAADGYTNVSMVLYEKDDTGVISQRTVSDKSQVGLTQRVYMMKLTMTYSYALDFINEGATHTMTAFAR